MPTQIVKPANELVRVETGIRFKVKAQAAFAVVPNEGLNYT
jgi:hypothetical protein